MPREGLMTTQDLARYLQCSMTTVRRWISRGEIPHIRLGKLVRFRRSEVDAWLTRYHEGEMPAEEGPEPLVHPDQLFLFGREVGGEA